MSLTIKLPLELEEEALDVAVRAVLEKETFQLYSDSVTHIPVLKLTDALRTNLFYAKSLGEMVLGYEVIEKALANELHGLLKVACPTDRVSRLLIVTNDGSPRFYRELEFLQRKQGVRVLICKLDIDSALMATILGCAGHVVKAVLLNRKRSVANVLKSLLPTGAP